MRYRGMVDIDLHVGEGHSRLWLHAREVSVRRVTAAVFARLATTREPLVRQRLLAAAGASRRPDAIARAHQLALGSELGDEELHALLVSQLDGDETRDERA